MREDQREDGIMFAVAGASRNWKTGWIKSRLARAERVLIWDPRGEYPGDVPGCLMVRSVPELARVLLDAWDGPVKVALWAPVTEFEKFAKRAYEWLQLWPGVVIVEEMHQVTNSGKATGSLGELIRQGLYYGGHIYAVCQRPQEIDKTTWANATVKHCHYLDTPLDCDYMGGLLGVDPGEFAKLKPGDWIEKRAGQREVFRGRVPRRA